MERMRALEVLFVSVQRAAAALVEVDGFDRWGRSNASADQLAKYEQQERENRIIYDRDKAALEAEVAALRTSAPDVLSRWVALHVQLLDEALVKEPRLEVAAKQDLAMWKGFSEGTRRLEDLLYSSAWVDPGRRRELLGG